MQTQQIQVSGAGERAHELRRELFAFSWGFDVFVAGRPDFLVLVCDGRPRPGECCMRCVRSATARWTGAVPDRRDPSADLIDYYGR